VFSIVADYLHTVRIRGPEHGGAETRAVP